MSDEPLPKSEIILYQTEDGRTRIQCRFENETLWLTQALIAELFQKDVRTVNEHLINIFAEAKLNREATIRKFRIVRPEGARQLAREVEHYNLATVQNKMHWATHGHTAAEIIHARADAGKPFMGMLTTRPRGSVRKEDAAVAKNYLTEVELQVLNRIVNLYLEYAELQALERKPMTMRDWIIKLDEFLKISGRRLLDHAGKISAEAAKAKAELEYDRFRVLMDSQPRPVDAAFEQAAKQLQKLPRPKRPTPPKPSSKTPP